MFNTLGWERLQARMTIITALMIERPGTFISYSHACLITYSTTHNINTRQATAAQLALPPLCNGHDIECFKSFYF
jgi:ethanolamine ammonia-lyase small subunit